MLGTITYGVSATNIPAVLIANGLGCRLILIILLSRHRRRQLGGFSWDGKFFYGMCRICFLLCVLETTGFLLDGRQFPGARLLYVFSNTVVLFLAVPLALLWVYFVGYKLFSDRRRFRTVYPFAAIPAGVTCLLTLVNLPCGIFFTVDSSNLYARSPLFFLPWAAVYGYMTAGALLACRCRRQVNKYLFMPVVFFLLPIYLGSLLQLLFYGIALIWVSVALGLILLYINLQNEEAYLDPLTKLYNRSYLLHHVDHMARQAKKGRQTVGIMLDIDDFKQINDTYGHSEGDLVLRAVGGILLRCVESHTVVVRYGGDEFVILLENANLDQIHAAQERIRSELQRYNESDAARHPLSLSVGTAVFDREDIFGFFQEMDRKMYREKRSFYLRREVEEASADTVG